MHVETDTGRVGQRRRTRRTIVDAAAKLIAENRDPSVAEVATAADVSRRTVYQYFPTLDQLLTEAALSGLRPSFERPIELAAGDVEARVDALIRTNWRMVHEAEPLGRTMIRLTVGRTGDRRRSTLPRRGYNRIEWIEKALEPLRDSLDKRRFEQLVSAIALCFGWEALLVLCDVRGLDNKQALEVSLWAARSLVKAAVEGAERPGSHGRKPTRRRTRNG